jgi:hypothetical protein
MSSEPDEALDVLREVWSARGQDSATVEEACEAGGGCKRFSDVGFDGMAGPDGDLRAAWKAKLEREGKLSSGGGSIRDLVLGTARAR